MDKNLQTLVFRFAEDREIPYISAQLIGQQYGKKFEDRQSLMEWKNKIDRYLKTFSESDWAAIEKDLGLI